MVDFNGPVWHSLPAFWAGIFPALGGFFLGIYFRCSFGHNVP